MERLIAHAKNVTGQAGEARWAAQRLNENWHPGCGESVMNPEKPAFSTLTSLQAIELELMRTSEEIKELFRIIQLFTREMWVDRQEVKGVEALPGAVQARR